jgi:hypothetical protein
MTPKDYFDEVWRRADLFATLHAYVINNVAPVIQPDELLRAEWAMRVSALDLYIHEVVSQNLLKIFQGTRPIFPRLFEASDIQRHADENSGKRSRSH